MDRVAAFLGEKTPRRAIALAAFVGGLYLFRHLALLLVFFVTFERALGWSSRALGDRLGIPRKKALILVLLGLVAAASGLLWLGIDQSIRAFTTVEATLPVWIDELRDNALVRQFEEHIGGTEKIVDGLKDYAGDAITAATAIGHFFVHLLIGFILAIVFVTEEDDLATFWARVDRRSLAGTLGRWIGHVADATIVTVQLQLIVAAFNTVTTLPVLLVLGVPHVGPLMVLIFVSALVPVIGNAVCGVILSLLAYQAKGWLGVGIFVGLTFVLHKIESYYLSPRLTARHVRIPGFLLIVSLIACEHLFGLKGLFLSFPILFVAGRIRAELLEDDALVAGADLRLDDRVDQIPAVTEVPPLSATGLELERGLVTKTAGGEHHGAEGQGLATPPPAELAVTPSVAPPPPSESA